MRARASVDSDEMLKDAAKVRLDLVGSTLVDFIDTMRTIIAVWDIILVFSPDVLNNVYASLKRYIGLIQHKQRGASDPKAPLYFQAIAQYFLQHLGLLFASCMSGRMSRVLVVAALAALPPHPSLGDDLHLVIENILSHGSLR